MSLVDYIARFLEPGVCGAVGDRGDWMARCGQADRLPFRANRTIARVQSLAHPRFCWNGKPGLTLRRIRCRVSLDAGFRRQRVGSRIARGIEA